MNHRLPQTFLSTGILCSVNSLHCKFQKSGCIQLEKGCFIFCWRGNRRRVRQFPSREDSIIRSLLHTLNLTQEYAIIVWHLIQTCFATCLLVWVAPPPTPTPPTPPPSILFSPSFPSFSFLLSWVLWDISTYV